MALQHRGTNLTGGDTLYSKFPAATGPVAGTHYQFVLNKDVDYCVAKGMNTFRLLFGWEVMQPTPRAAIPGGLTGNWRAYYDRFKALVDYITVTKGCNVIIDIHGGADPTFAAYYGVKVGSTYNGIPVQDLLVDLWTQLATIFKGNSRVMFGVTNEPTGLPTMTWFTCAQAVINGIRKTGALNKIVMPGSYFSGAGSWTSTSQFDTGATKRSNAYGWENANGVGKPLTDPANNLCVQVHMYFDANSGGGADDIPNDTVGVTRLKVVVDWARSKGLQVMLAECALKGTNPIAKATWDKTVAFMDANSDVLLGFMWWAYGPISWWGGYTFTMCPSANYLTDSAQMLIVAPTYAVPPLPAPPPLPPAGPTQAAYDALKLERDKLKTERDSLVLERTALLATRDALTIERDGLKVELTTCTAQGETLAQTLADTQTQLADVGTRYTTTLAALDLLVGRCTWIAEKIAADAAEAAAAVPR
jgi:endoglucanase